MKITYIHHACVMIEHNGKVIVSDPFFPELGPIVKQYPQFAKPDYIVLTHGHNDHIGSIGSLLTSSPVVLCIVELASYLRKQGVKNVVGLNFGGKVAFGDISFSLVPAVHTSANNGVYLGEAAGFVLSLGDKTVYHAGDTDAFGDMSLIQKFFKPDIGLLPIGGHYTMDEEKAAFCCNEFFAFDTVIPIHYDTFPEISASCEKFASLTKTKVLPLKPLQSAEFR